MPFIKSSLSLSLSLSLSPTGITLSWFLRFHERYNNYRCAFASASKKRIFHKKTAQCEQIEAQASTKQEIENGRYYFLKCQQLVAKGWCSESAATTNFKCNVILTRG